MEVSQLTFQGLVCRAPLGNVPFTDLAAAACSISVVIVCCHSCLSSLVILYAIPNPAVLLALHKQPCLLNKPAYPFMHFFFTQVPYRSVCQRLAAGPQPVVTWSSKPSTGVQTVHR